MTRLGKLYDRFARLLLILCLLTATGGVVIGTTATVQNARQDAANAALLDCLNDYAAEQSTSSQAVREAAVKVDAATVKRDRALNAEGVAFLEFVDNLRAGEVTGVEDLAQLAAALRARAAAAAALAAAQDALDQVRKENPIPAPPAVFCDLQEDDQ